MLFFHVCLKQLSFFENGLLKRATTPQTHKGRNERKGEEQRNPLELQKSCSSDGSDLPGAPRQVRAIMLIDDLKIATPWKDELSNRRDHNRPYCRNSKRFQPFVLILISPPARALSAF